MIQMLMSCYKFPFMCNKVANAIKQCSIHFYNTLMIITANPNRILNKRSELISKCRHENKFYLRNN